MNRCQNKRELYSASSENKQVTAVQMLSSRSSQARVQMSPAERVRYTHLGSTQSNRVTLCPTTFQKPECPGRQARLCFSPALAAGRASAGASASTQPLLSAPRGFEERPPPDPEREPAPWSWSAPGSSWCACPSEACVAESWPVEAGGPGSGCGCADGGAERGLASSAAAKGRKVC